MSQDEARAREMVEAVYRSDSRRVLASIKNLAATLGAKIVFGVKAEEEEDLVLMIGAMNLESFAQRLRNYDRQKLIVVVGDRLEIQDLAIRDNVLPPTMNPRPRQPEHLRE